MPTAAQQHYARSVVARRKADKARQAEYEANLRSLTDAPVVSSDAQEIVGSLLGLAR